MYTECSVAGYLSREYRCGEHKARHNSYGYINASATSLGPDDF
jgi:hypothetical protein